MADARLRSLGEAMQAGLPVDTPITTRQAETFSVNGSLAITDASGRTANIVALDLLTGNGVIHVIDRAIPPGL